MMNEELAAAGGGEELCDGAVCACAVLGTATRSRLPRALSATPMKYAQLLAHGQNRAE